MAASGTSSLPLNATGSWTCEGRLGLGPTSCLAFTSTSSPPIRNSSLPPSRAWTEAANSMKRHSAKSWRWQKTKASSEPSVHVLRPISHRVNRSTPRTDLAASTEGHGTRCTRSSCPTRKMTFSEQRRCASSQCCPSPMVRPNPRLHCGSQLYGHVGAGVLYRPAGILGSKGNGPSQGASRGKTYCPLICRDPLPLSRIGGGSSHQSSHLASPSRHGNFRTARPHRLRREKTGEHAVPPAAAPASAPAEAPQQPLSRPLPPRATESPAPVPQHLHHPFRKALASANARTRGRGEQPGSLPLRGRPRRPRWNRTQAKTCRCRPANSTPDWDSLRQTKRRCVSTRIGSTSYLDLGSR